MASANLVVILGNLTRDVDLKQIQNGTSVCDIGVAINERVKQGDDWVEKTVFCEVTCWGRTAENVAKFLSKGSPAHIIGRLHFEQWEQDGQKRSKLKVIADKVQFVGTKGDGSSQQSKPDTSVRNYPQSQQRRAAGSQARAARSGSPPDEDIPFGREESVWL